MRGVKNVVNGSDCSGLAEDKWIYPTYIQACMYSGIDAVQLADERELAAEKAAVCEYELRLAREDIKSLQEKLASCVEVAEDLSGPGVCLFDLLI